MDRQPQRAPVSASPFNGAWPLRRSLLAAQDLAHQVAAWHARGRLHGQVRLENIEVLNEHRVILAPPQGARRFGGINCNLEWCPPELAGETDIRLGEDLQSAAAALRRNGITFDPRRIDVYQISAVLCQWLTGTTVQAYADSLHLKLQVPAAARDLLDRGLGFDSSDRLQTCEEFSQAIAAALVEDLRSGPATIRDTHRAVSAALSDTDASHVASTPLPFISQSGKISQLAHFQLLELIGRGGMGEVYRARDTKLDRIVAVKVLRQELAGDGSFVRRFQSEANALARMPHPNLLPLYFTGIDQGRRFFVMRLVDGESLADRLRNSPCLPVPQVLEIAAQCLSALAVAHDEGLIHRDIKPANVLLERNSNQSYLVDFGLARRIDDETNLTRTGVVMGTVEYLSPEQARGVKQIDHRADLYSFGVMLYQMLSGQLPFSADSAVGWIFQHAHESAAPLAVACPEVPRELCALVDEMLAKRPEDRPADCHDVLQRIKPYLQTDVRIKQFSTELAAACDDDDCQDDAGVFANAPITRIGRWTQIRDQAATLLRRHTPEWIQRLQSTEQEIEGVIARYQRRLRRLQAMQVEGQEILAALQSQRDFPVDAPISAIATDSASRERQLEYLRERMAEIDLAAAKLNTTLLRLTSQRDAMLARIKLLAPTSNRAPHHTRVPYIAAALAVCSVALSGLAWQTGWLAFDGTPEGPTVQVTASPTPPSNSPRGIQPAPVPPFDYRSDQEAAKLVLTLKGNIQVRAGGVEQQVTHLAQLPLVPYRVIAIDLTKCTGIEAKHTKIFGDLQELERIELLHTRIDDDTFAPLAKLDQLVFLGCGNTAVTGKDLNKFRSLPSLTTISFGGSFQGENLVHFQTAENLTEIYLGWTNLDDSSLSSLPHLPKVRSLICDRTKVTGTGLASLTGLPELRRLHLSFTPITDEGLSHLPSLPFLETLELEDTAIGDASVAHLQKLTSLRKLNLKQTNVTADGLTALRAALPNCAIEHSPSAQQLAEEQLNILTQRIAKNDRDLDALKKRSELHQQWQRFGEAAKDAEQFLAVSRNSLWMQLQLAMYSLAVGDEGKYFAVCREIDADHRQELLAEPLGTRLHAARVLSLRPQSLATLEALFPHVEQIYKDSPESYVLCPQVSLSYRLKRYDEVVALGKRLTSAESLSERSIGYIYLAMAYFQLGRVDEAKHALLQAQESVKSFPRPGDKANGYSAYIEASLVLPEAEALVK